MRRRRGGRTERAAERGETEGSCGAGKMWTGVSRPSSTGTRRETIAFSLERQIVGWIDCGGVTIGGDGDGAGTDLENGPLSLTRHG